MTSDQGEIDRTAGQKTLEMLTAVHGGDLVTVEITENDVGDQFAAEHEPFSYIEYDRHDDAVSVGVSRSGGTDPVGVTACGRASAEHLCSHR